jgi:predicted dienelactone hydrolase
VPVPALARWLPGLGIAAALAATVAHGPGHGPAGAAVAAWPAVALVGSYELFMTIIRGARQPGNRVSGAERVPGAVSGTDPLRVQAAEVSGADVAAGRVPSIRAIRSRLRVGQPRAQQVRAYLAALGDG